MIVAHTRSRWRLRATCLVSPLLLLGACDRRGKLVQRTPEAMAAHIQGGELPRHDGPARPIAIADMTPGAVGVGKVTAIDRPRGKLTLQHDPVSAGDWPTLTMTAVVRPPSLLDQIKVGERIRFHLEYRIDAPEVVALEPDTPGGRSDAPDPKAHDRR